MRTKLNLRATALAGVSALALSSSGALAQVTSYEYILGNTDPTPITGFVVTDYLLAGENNQRLNNAVDADVTDNSTTVTGPNDDANVTVNVNDYTATAIGNIASTTAIDATNQDEAWGLRILSSQIASPGAVITADATGEEIGADLTDFATGNVTVNDNDIIAGVTVNDATNTLSGIPSVDEDAGGTLAAGRITGGTSAGGAINLDVADAHSSLVNAQFNAGAGVAAGSGAVVSGSSIFIDDDATGDIEATLSLGGNDIAASYTGNTAVNRAEDPSDVEYAGSVLIGNVQVNVEGGAVADASAQVTGSQVLATLDSDSLSGVLSVSDNRIGADSLGNAATNELVFGEGVSIEGENDVASVDMDDDGDTFTVTGFEADLGIASAQANIDTTFRSVVDGDSRIGATLSGDLAGGTLTVSDNNVSASASGNESEHVIAADGPVFGATAAIGGFQTNDETAIVAEVTGPGGIDGMVGASVDGGLTGGAVLSANGNLVEAVATGNVSDSRILLDAENLSAGSELASVSTDAATGAGDAVASGGAVATNLQSNIGEGTGLGFIDATVDSVNIGLTVGDGVDSSTATLDGNTIDASATGNSGFTAIQLTGVDGAASAGVGNVQINDVEVSALLTNSQVGMGLVGGVDGSTVSLSDNALSASAVANTGDNRLLATGFSTLTVGSGDPAYEGSVAAGSAEAVFALSSSQESRENVSATIEVGSDPGDGGADIVIQSLGAVTDSVVGITGNSMSALASGNDVANTLRIDAVVLENVDAGTADLIGAIANEQTILDGANVIATVDAAGLDGDGGIALGVTDGTDALPISRSTVAIDGNAILAAADGNFGANNLTATGTTHVGADDPAGTGDNFGFVVSSDQTVGDSSITALVTDAYISTWGLDADDSTISVSGNSQTAQARSNVAINTLNLGVAEGEAGYSSLTTSAQISNVQTSGATVDANVTDASVGLDFASSDGSTLTVSGNSLGALGVGNASSNRMNVAALNLNGGGNDGMENDFVVLNSQTNTGGITASVTGATVGVNVGGPGQAITNGSANVLNNTASARGFGNDAVNTLAMSTLASSGTSALVSNTQVNSGPVTASVTGMNLGITTAGVTSAPTTVRGNSISATAVGNSAVNTISRSR